MKVLVYGHKGWIGQQFLYILNEQKIDYMCGRARCDRNGSVDIEISYYKPTHVISFIGRTHGSRNGKTYSTIDYLETPDKLSENMRDNLFAPITLAEVCRKHNVHYTYLGTGCIFKFDDEHPYGEEKNGFTEDSIPNFFGSQYSIVKGYTDRLMHNYAETTLNLRIRMPISNIDNPRNFITKITKYEHICSQPNSMTVLPELLPIALDMMKNNTTGTINFTNPGLICHNEILEMYRDKVDSEFKWKNFSPSEQKKILAADRSNNYLDTTRLESLYPNIKNIKESVGDMLSNFKF
tara:strand:+ start:491 stop:1372 length:882 start_codon:yes stop_codon:yes gene_type:complete